MDDLISRQAAIDAIGDKNDEIFKTKQKGATYPHDDFFLGMAYAENVVKQLPSAQPEIIRCRDCKHWDKTWTNNWSPDYHYCPMVDGVHKGDFYCADAERRTDD